MLVDVFALSTKSVFYNTVEKCSTGNFRIRNPNHSRCRRTQTNAILFSASYACSQHKTDFIQRFHPKNTCSSVIIIQEINSHATCCHNGHNCISIKEDSDEDNGFNTVNKIIRDSKAIKVKLVGNNISQTKEKKISSEKNH